MYSVSTAFKTACKSLLQSSRLAKITLVDTEQEITESNDLTSMQIESKIYTPSSGFLGTAIQKKLTATIINDEAEYIFENEEITAKAGITIANVGEYVDFGNFIITEVTNKEASILSNITAYDYMIKFNKQYTENNTYPISTFNFIEALCTQCDVVLGSTSFNNDDFVIPSALITTATSCQALLSDICGKIVGGYAEIGRDNKLYIKSISNTIDSDTTLETIDANNYYSFNRNKQYGIINSLLYKSNIDGITDVEVKDDASISANGKKQIIIENSIFITTQLAMQAVAEAIFVVLNGLKYNPIEIDCVGLPYLDCGDKIIIKDIEDVSYNTFVLSSTFNFNGGFGNIISAEAPTEAKTEYDNSGDLVNNLNKIKDLANTAQTDADNALEYTTALSSDTKITPDEKYKLKQQWDLIVLEGKPTTTIGTIVAQADTFGVSHVDFSAKYAILNTYLNTTLTIFADMTATTTIVRADWDTAWTDYYNERTKLLNALASEAKKRGDDAQTTANTKKRNFVTTPTTPYEIGDTWTTGNDIYKCITQRLTGSYNASDWELTTLASVKYEDVANKIMKLGGSGALNGYGKLEVYDNNDILTGTFDKNGVALESGNFTIKQSYYSNTSLQLPNLVNDHSFELVNQSSGVMIDNINDNMWRIDGDAPYVSVGFSKFGNQCIEVSPSARVKQLIPAKSETTYVFSGYINKMDPPDNPNAYIYIYYYSDLAGTTAIVGTDETATLGEGNYYTYERVFYEFTTPLNTASFRIVLSSVSLPGEPTTLLWDGIQIVEGTLPCIYNPETQLWEYIQGHLSTNTTISGNLKVTGNIYKDTTNIMLLAYPVGAIYMSAVSTSPATLFGGTWTQLKDCFLLTAGDIYTAGATGGEETHTLTVAELAAHGHKARVYSTYGTGGYRAGSSGGGTMTTSTYIDEVAGSGAAHNNMPPYTVVYSWKRTA